MAGPVGTVEVQLRWTRTFYYYVCLGILPLQTVNCIGGQQYRLAMESWSLVLWPPGACCAGEAGVQRIWASVSYSCILRQDNQDVWKSTGQAHVVKHCLFSKSVELAPGLYDYLYQAGDQFSISQQGPRAAIRVNTAGNRVSCE